MATHKVPYDEMKKTGFVMIKGNPCKVLDCIKKTKGTGPTANDRVTIKGQHVFSPSVKCEDVFNLTPGFSGMEVPISSSAKYSLIDIDLDTGFITLLTDAGETKEDAALTKAEEDGDEDFDALGNEIARRFEEGEALKVTVLTIMGRDLVTAVAQDFD